MNTYEQIVRFRAEMEVRLRDARNALRARGVDLRIPAPDPHADPVERNLELLEAVEQAEAAVRRTEVT